MFATNRVYSKLIPNLRARMSKFLQTFHTAVWPGDGQSVKFWARSKLPNSRYQWKHRKRAFFGVSKAHISGRECPTFFKPFHTAVPNVLWALKSNICVDDLRPCAFQQRRVRRIHCEQWVCLTEVRLRRALQIAVNYISILLQPANLALK